MIFDGHSDILSYLYYNNCNNIDDFYYENYKFMISVIYLKKNDNKFFSFYKQFLKGNKAIKLSNNFKVITKIKDFSIDKTNIILGIENLEALQDDLDYFKFFYNRGVRHVILTWNYNNKLAGGAKDTGRITKQGIKFLKYFNKKKIILDLSHLNYNSFFDCLYYYKKPVICSHSNVYNLCNHPRNLKDNQIIKIKENKGLIGVCSVKDFISNDITKQNIFGLVDHIDYIKNLIGIDYICLGMDYMGFTKIDSDNLEELAFYKDTIKIKDELLKRNYSTEEINKIFFMNLYEFCKNILD